MGILDSTAIKLQDGTRCVIVGGGVGQEEGEEGRVDGDVWEVSEEDDEERDGGDHQLVWY